MSLVGRCIPIFSLVSRFLVVVVHFLRLQHANEKFEYHQFLYGECWGWHFGLPEQGKLNFTHFLFFFEIYIFLFISCLTIITVVIPNLILYITCWYKRFWSLLKLDIFSKFVRTCTRKKPFGWFGMMFLVGWKII
jgi:hypothetical protein